MISVVIPVYNQADKLIKTLESLLQQTNTDFEVIIVNDGSHDNPEQLFSDFISKIASTDIPFYFFNQENKGAPAARNYGLAKSKGEYLFFCDADAVLVPEAFQKLVAALEAVPTASYAYPSFYWGKKLFTVGPFSEDKLRRGPFIHTMALVRRADLPSGGWDETIRKFQDWDLWLTMLENGKTGLWVEAVLFTVATGGTMSFWLPSIAYKLLPFLPSVKKYNKAFAVIKAKHHLA
jgi:glycosyltransferase involved in cell wall biosynthesis